MTRRAALASASHRGKDQHVQWRDCRVRLTGFLWGQQHCWGRDQRAADGAANLPQSRKEVFIIK